MTLRLERPAVRIGLGVDAATRIGWAVGITYTKAGLMQEDENVAVEIRDLMKAYAISPEVFVHLTRTSTGAEMRLHAGPWLETWQLQGGRDRTRLGGQIALSLGFPLDKQWTVSIRGSGVLIPSIFESEDVSSDVDRLSTMRWTAAVGLAYQL